MPGARTCCPKLIGACTHCQELMGAAAPVAPALTRPLFNEFLFRFRSRTSATSGLGGAVANPTSGFYSGLSSEVNAIEMSDLSKARSNNDATSTKNTMISSCNTPTCLTSLTDLTKIGKTTCSIVLQGMAYKEQVLKF